MTAEPNMNQPGLDCLICGGPEIDEAMKQPEFTEIFRCFLQLLSLATDDLEEMRLSDVIVCLNCGVKFRQIYLLQNQLLDIQNQLRDYRTQMEKDLVETFMRTVTVLSTVSKDVNSILRKRIIDGLQLQITSSVPPAQTFIEDLTEQDVDNNTSTENLHSQPPNSSALDFENNVIFCSTVDDQGFEIKIEFETNAEAEAEDSLNNVDYSSLPSIFSVEATEVSREPGPDITIHGTSLDIEDNSESYINEIEDHFSSAALPSSRKRRKISPSNQNNGKESEENIPLSEKKSAGNRTFKIGTTVFKNPFVLLEVLPSVLALGTDISPTTKELQAASTSIQVLDEDVDVEVDIPSPTSDAIDFETNDKFTDNNGPRPRLALQKCQTGALLCTVAECKKTFSTRRQQRRHVKYHSSIAVESINKKPVRKPLVRIPPASYVCEHCGQTLKTRKIFEIHLRSHGPIQYKCQYCSRGYRDKVNLRAHEAIKHTGDRPYACSHCDVKFASQKLVRNHKLREHEEYFVNGKSPFECDTCHIVLANVSGYRMHMYQHNGAYPFRCHICGIGQPNKKAHDIHMKYHGEEKEFLCSVCEKAFKFKDTLEIHMRSHTGERPHQCKSCPKNYIDRAALGKHTRAVHNDGGTRFICHLCGKINPSSHYLNIHLTSHRRKEERAARPRHKSKSRKKAKETINIDQ